MIKILARAAQAHKQASRRLKRVREAKEKQTLNRLRQSHVEFQKLVADDRRASRAEEKEDHRLGPLKPRRAVGKQELETFGAFDRMRLVPPKVPEKHRIRFWNIVEKDRVVILTGRDRHKIGTVKRTDKENNTLIVEGLNMMPARVLDSYREKLSSLPVVSWSEAPLHYDDVRLVVPSPDPETKELRDVIVANVAVSNAIENRDEGEWTWTRYIQGTQIEIPWPEKTEEPEHFDQLPDTLIMDVEAVTYTPSLLRAPFPESVVDELRNKYSRFRVRHDRAFVEKVEAAARKEKEDEAEMRKAARTPLQLLNKKLRDERRARGRPVLTPAVMEQIGRLMAQNRPELLQQARQQAQTA